MIDGTRGLSCPRTVPATETGEDRPDGDCEPSERIWAWASSNPVALALDEPTAGAAFWLSVPPICSLCRAVGKEVLDTEARDSVGLVGRSTGTETGKSDTTVLELDGVRLSGCARVGLRASRTLGVCDREVADPLIMASLLRKSSKGAPGGPVV